MTPESAEELYDKFVLGNYPKAPLTLVEGRGIHVWDDEGREYLDFTAGIGVNALGHSHPFWVQQVAQQASRLVHTTNLFRNELQGRVAGILVDKAGPGRVFFCNSGLEANEALFKLARRHGLKKAGSEGKCFKIISARKSFHGRSFASMAATDSERVNGGYAPLLPGFVHADFNDAASFEAAVDGETAAIILETVQGEGGIHPGTVEFMRQIREICDRHDLLLLLDEVQCGIGRTGTFFAFEESGIVPDAVAMAKGLGGGFPIGAMWVREKHSGLFPPSSHGTTFGGSPLACSAALATLTVIERENLLENVRENGAYWLEILKRLETDFPDLVVSVRGRGFMIGVQLTVEPPKILELMRSMGLLAMSAGGNVIRFLPPLNTGRKEIESAVRIFRSALSRFQRGG